MMPVKIRGRGIEVGKQSLHLWCRYNTCGRRVGRVFLQGRSEQVLASQMGRWSAMIIEESTLGRSAQVSAQLLAEGFKGGGWP